MDEASLRKQYLDLINDFAYEELEEKIQEPNIFSILKIVRKEIRHSNFLAWLLDPNEVHGLGKSILIKFVRDVVISGQFDSLDIVQVEQFILADLSVKREWKNIDLLLKNDQIVICIENKIDAFDSHDQLANYRAIVNEEFPRQLKIFIYLSPYGILPTAVNERQNYVSYSYERLIEHIEQTLTVRGESLSNKVRFYIQDYVKSVKLEIMKSDSLNRLAVEIYKNHKEILDFILEHKSDLAWEVYPYFQNSIKDLGWTEVTQDKGYIRWLPTELHGLVPKVRFSTSREIELFYFEIDFLRNSRKASFRTVIAPTSDPKRHILDNLLSNMEHPYKRNVQGHNWLLHIERKFDFNNDDFVDMDERQFSQLMQEQWGWIEETVQSVSPVVMQAFK
jgi:hypothetical protein